MSAPAIVTPSLSSPSRLGSLWNTQVYGGQCAFIHAIAFSLRWKKLQASSGQCWHLVPAGVRAPRK